jgi:cell division transport system permease protein
MLGFLLVVGTAFTIANVVRLTILLHRDEIEVLRLVGAPEFLIRGPFLVGGMAQGLAVGIVALGALRLLFEGLVRWVATTQNILLGVFVVRFLPAAPALLLVGGGLFAGLLGGALAVRKRNLPA